jgi:hypothetical protein
MRHTTLSPLAAALALALLLPVTAAAAPGTHPAPDRPAPKRDKDIVAWWDFQENPSGQIRNCVPGGQHGVNHGARWSGGALEFDGEDDCVSIGQYRKLASLATGSISVWFKIDSARFGDCVQPVFYFGDPDGGADNSSLIIELGHFWPDRKTTSVYFTIFGVPGQTPTFCFDSNVDLDLDTWYHFVAVVGEGFNTGYLNGVELIDRHYNFGGPNDTVFFDDVVHLGTCTIGRGFFAFSDVPCYFDGMIGDVRIYNRALTGGEVAAIYDQVRNDADGSDRVSAAARAPRGSSAAGPVALLGSRPNPFNPATRIRFSVAERSHVTLRVYSAAGRLVRTLLQTEVEPGVREIAWDGTDATGRPAGSGVYFCRLESGDGIATTKLILGK